MTSSVAATAVAGRYLIGDSFASGGMGTIHLGRVRGAGGFARTVAVKRLFPGHAHDAAFRQMLIDEARLASRIRHPNVVPTLDVWEEQDDLYVVMEYVHGISLARVLKLSTTGPMPVPIALGILEGILSGLHAAHEARAEDGTPLGMVHRDVSPQNILVGADGVPRLIDFGVAKAATGLQVTEPGVVKGKTGYMAPEQLLGQRVSRHADIFAVSAVLWEVLTNRTLLEEHGEDALRLRITSGEDVPPSRYRESVCTALDTVVLRALALRPGDRFPTAEAMAGALRKVEVPAPAVDIARWVRQAAGDELEISEERVRLFEQSPDASSSLPMLPESNEPDSGITSAVTKAGRTGLARGELFGPPQRTGARVGRSRAVVSAAVLVGLGALGLSYLGREHGAGGQSASEAASLPPVPLPATPTIPPAVDPAPSGGVAHAASSTPSASSATPAAFERRVRSSAPSSAKPATPRKPKCDPPYTMDSNGRKTYDTRCF